MKSSPRLQVPDRAQLVFEDCCLDRQLPHEHRARQVWAFVVGLDLSMLEARVRSRDGVAGAPAISPRLLLALWLQATLDGVGSAREIARRCEEHMAYRWLCGRVSVNHHTLSDFRAEAGDALDALLSNVVAALVKAEADDPAVSARVRAARERAAEERGERVGAALAVMKEITEKKARPDAKKRPDRTDEPRASTTDADARVMKAGSGGTRPAYNVQLATDGKSRAIVGLQVTSNPVDYGLSEAMRAEVERRTGVTVKTHVTDAGYLNKETIEREEAAGVVRILPLPRGKQGTPCTQHQPDDGPGVRAWRERMQTEEAKTLLKQRPGIAETPNAELKTQRGLDRMLVRGLKNVTGVMLMGAIIYNLVHFATELIGRPLTPI